MSLPAPTLEWKQLMDYSFISEFELLRHSRSHQDITTQAWTVPANREMTNKHFKILWAREEIQRVNIEMHRLRTFIRDEHCMFEEHITRLHESDPLLAAEIQVCSDWRSRVNIAHTRRLDKIEALRGFTGIRGPGTRRGIAVIDVDTVDGMSGSPVTNDMAERADVSSMERADGLLARERGAAAVDDEADGDDGLEEQVLSLSEAIAVEATTQGVPNSMLFNWSLS